MEIGRLNQKEISAFRDLIVIFNSVFENEYKIPGDQHLGRLLNMPDFMVFVVRINGKVVGGLTVYILHSYYSEKPKAYVYDVATATEYQGNGFGSSLIAHVCAYLNQHGFEEAWVEAESEDIKAVEFYRKTAFTNEMSATHFTYLFDL